MNSLTLIDPIVSLHWDGERPKGLATSLFFKQAQDFVDRREL